MILRIENRVAIEIGSEFEKYVNVKMLQSI